MSDKSDSAANNRANIYMKKFQPCVITYPAAHNIPNNIHGCIWFEPQWINM